MVTPRKVMNGEWKFLNKQTKIFWHLIAPPDLSGKVGLIIRFLGPGYFLLRLKNSILMSTMRVKATWVGVVFY